MNRFALLAILGISLGAICGCGPGGSELGGARRIDHANYSPEALSDSELAAARALDVYFEHASVGSNIVGGIDALAVIEPRYASGHTGFPGETDATAWWASNDGLLDNARGNPDWSLKVSGFQDRMTTALAGSLDVAMFKFCYIDQGADFETTRTAMEALEAAYPALAFVWWTMPITTGDADNVLRRNYNELVRDYCEANDKWLLDIADLESHDGSGVAQVDGDGVEALFAGYTDDGGHLNAAGAEKLALAYWRLLAEIAAAR